MKFNLIIKIASKKDIATQLQSRPRNKTIKK